MPHPPQFDASLSVSCSQPSRNWPLQFAQPLAHASTTQSPSAHEEAATLSASQVRPQPPQFAVSEVTSVSQPFAKSPSQSPSPSGQALIWQVVPTQRASPPSTEQALKQPPQCVSLSTMRVSQPVFGWRSQSAYSGSQETIAQKPALHVPAPFAGRHWLEQKPQFSGSAMRFTAPVEGLAVAVLPCPRSRSRRTRPRRSG